MLGAAATLCAFVSCQKDNLAGNKTGFVKVDATAEVVPETKVTLGELKDGKFPMSWGASGEFIKVCEIVDDATFQKVDSEEGVIDPATGKAHFGFTLTEASGDNFDYYAISPKTAYNALAADKVKVKMPVAQTPTATSPDPAAIIMFASSTANSEQPTELDLKFKPLVSVVKMNVKDLELPEEETLANIQIGFNSKPMASLYSYTTATGKWSAEVGNSTFSHIDINPANITVDDDFDVWFATLPFTVIEVENDLGKPESYLDFWVCFVTDKGTRVSKNCTAPKGFKFAAGHVVNLDFDMSDVTVPAFSVEFDFSQNLYEWPTTGQADPAGYWHPGSDGEEYYFQYRMAYFKTNGCFQVGNGIYADPESEKPGYSWLKFPNVEGYRLTGVYVKLFNKDAERTMSVTEDIEGTQFVSGGEIMSYCCANNKFCTEINRTLVDTETDVDYYFTAGWSKRAYVPFTSLILTYSE